MKSVLVAAPIFDGRIAGFVETRHLAGEGIHYEARWFKPWPTGKCDQDDLMPYRVLEAMEAATIGEE